jgi:hypothetical protein
MAVGSTTPFVICALRALAAQSPDATRRVPVVAATIITLDDRSIPAGEVWALHDWWLDQSILDRAPPR